MRRSKIGLFVGLLFVSLSSSAYAGQIARYEAEGNANDMVGTHNGSLVNGAGYGSGVFGQAFSLSANNQQYVTVPDDSAWTLGSNDFSLSLWVNFTSISPLGVGSLPNTFIGHDQGGGSAPKWIFGYNALGSMYFHINGSGGSTFLTSGSTLAPTTNSWHLYTMTRSGSNYKFYFDGAIIGSDTSSLQIEDAAAPLTIGQAEGIGYLDGRVDDVRVYDNALTSTEVRALVPEPSTIITAGVGVAILLRRRKRS